MGPGGEGPSRSPPPGFSSHVSRGQQVTLTRLEVIFGFFYKPPVINLIMLIQTEAERRRREAGVKQSMEIRVRSCMYVCIYVWYLELSREPRHVAQQTRYQNVGLGNGHCLGTISSGCDF